MTTIRYIAVSTVRLVPLVLSLLAWAEPVVIVNEKNNAPVDVTTVQQIFLAKSKVFPGGVEAMPVDSASSQNAFAEKYLQKSPESLSAYWSKLSFTGVAKPIKKLDSDEAVLKFVQANTAAIGYVESSKLGPGVKVIAR